MAVSSCVHELTPPPHFGNRGEGAKPPHITTCPYLNFISIILSLKEFACQCSNKIATKSAPKWLSEFIASEMLSGRLN